MQLAAAFAAAAEPALAAALDRVRGVPYAGLSTPAVEHERLRLQNLVDHKACPRRYCLLRSVSQVRRNPHHPGGGGCAALRHAAWARSLGGEAARELGER